MKPSAAFLVMRSCRGNAGDHGSGAGEVVGADKLPSPMWLEGFSCSLSLLGGAEVALARDAFRFGFTRRLG